MSKPVSLETWERFQRVRWPKNTNALCSSLSECLKAAPAEVRLSGVRR